MAIEPLRVGRSRSQRLLQFIVFDDAALFDVDEEDSAGLQPALSFDVRGIDRQDPHFTRKDDALVLSHPVARGAKSVAVEYRPGDGAVAKRHGRWSVPRFHETR